MKGTWSGNLLPLILMIIWDVIGVGGQFTISPADAAVVATGTVSLECEIGDVPLVETPRWYRYVGNPPTAQELWNGRENRYFIAGNRNAGTYNLFINSTKVTDSGLYSCTYGAASTPNVTLTVLPPSWLPVCQRSPADELLQAGDIVEISCASTGSSRTQLRWLRNDESVIAGRTTYNGTTVTVTHYEVLSGDTRVTFTCEASVPGISSPHRCSLGPYPENNESSVDAFIPFIVVGLLSVVVILLFFIVLFILFRHRQCRFCKRQTPDPQMVLDADAIAAGHGFPTVIVDDDDDDDQTGLNNSVISNNQPDVVSSVMTRVELSQKSPNSTLRNNMERGKRGSIPSKKHSEIDKLKPSEIRKLKKKQRSPSGTSRVENADVVSASSSLDERDRDTPSSLSIDLNVTPRSQTTSPTNGQSDQSQPGTSSDPTGTSSINDLDASIGRKSKFTKKKGSGKSSVSSLSSHANILESANHGRQSDTVIYAELDFSKSVPMNIMGDERL
ncbi:uncharacterized protein [Diadema setosum]|uniref:uncharacterized protein n=1 Tax=Diadema setosum TaxID=31175 RepID=UPI003B3A9F3A